MDIFVMFAFFVTDECIPTFFIHLTWLSGFDELTIGSLSDGLTARTDISSWNYSWQSSPSRCLRYKRQMRIKLAIFLLYNFIINFCDKL